MTWLRKEAAGARSAATATSPAQEVPERIEYELGVIEQMGFPAYFLVVADICQYARDNEHRARPRPRVGHRRWSPTSPGSPSWTRSSTRLLFERFLNPERISMPDVDLDFDERRRGDMIRYVTEKYGEDNVSLDHHLHDDQVQGRGQGRQPDPGLPVRARREDHQGVPARGAWARRSRWPRSSTTTHDRYGEAGELRTMYEDDPDVKKVIDTAPGHRGPDPGHRRARGRRHPVLRAAGRRDADPPPGRRRRAIITGFHVPECEYMGSLKMDFLGLRNLTVISDAVENVKANRGIDIDMLKLPLTTPRPTSCWPRGDTLGVFQLDGGDAQTCQADGARPGSRTSPPSSRWTARARWTANSHINYALRKNGQQKVDPGPPGAGGAAGGDPRRDLPPGGLPGAGHGHRPQLAGYTPRRRRPAAPGDGQEEERRSWTSSGRCSPPGMKDNGYSDEATQAVWDVLLPFSGYGFNKSHTAGYGLVSYWTAYLKANYPAEYMAALLTSVGDDKDKMAVYLAESRRHGHQGAAARRQRVAAAVRRRRRRHPVRARRDPQRGRERRRRLIVRPRGQGQVHSVQRLPRQGPARRLQQAGGRVADQGRRLRHPRAPAQGPVAGPRAGRRRGHQREAQRGHRPGLDLFGTDGRPADGERPDRPGGADPRRASGRARLLLAYEREMLGLYVSEPPAGRGRGAAGAQPRHSIADILDGAGGNGSVRVAGIITSRHQEDHQEGQRVGARRDRGPRRRHRGRLLPQDLPALRSRR